MRSGSVTARWKFSSALLWAISTFVGSFAISLFVDDLAMSLRIWLDNRIGSPGLSILAYNSVHYLLFQLAVILLLIGVTGGTRKTAGRALILLFAITAGKLAGRSFSELSPTLSQAAFSIVVSTALSASTIVLSEDLLGDGEGRKSDPPYFLWTATFVAVTFWFAAFPLVDRFGNPDISNATRIGMVLTLAALGYLGTRGVKIRWTLLPLGTMTAYLTVALLVSSLLADVLTGTRTLASLPPVELILYAASRAPLAFYLSMIGVAGNFVRRLLASRPD
ncbi:MAG: hypothetical protein NYU90_07070 [Aigarchaeota archaeon]|nr:hypothetical protein [Candidatus Calditenuis fumarioli]